MSGAYLIENTSGGLSFTINPGRIDGPRSTTSRNSDLSLYGDGTTQWGAGIQTNIFRLAENFACFSKVDGDHLPVYLGGTTGTVPNTDYLVSVNGSAPKDEVDLGVGRGISLPLVGQSWYNTDSNIFLIWTGSQWKIVGGATFDGTITVSTTEPRIELVDPSEAVNEKWWDVVASGSNFNIQSYDDAHVAFDVAISIPRTGIVAGVPRITDGSGNLNDILHIGGGQTINDLTVSPNSLTVIRDIIKNPEDFRVAVVNWDNMTSPGYYMMDGGNDINQPVGGVWSWHLQVFSANNQVNHVVQIAYKHENTFHRQHMRHYAVATGWTAWAETMHTEGGQIISGNFQADDVIITNGGTVSTTGITLNEGNGNAGVGPDISMTASGLITAGDNMYMLIDSTNISTVRQFIWGHNNNKVDGNTNYLMQLGQDARLDIYGSARIGSDTIGSASSLLEFRDRSGGAWRSITWDDADSDFKIEDNTGALYSIIHSGGNQIIDGLLTLSDNTATNGCTMIQSKYTAGNNDFLNIIGSQYSTASTVISYAVRPKQNSAGYISSADNVPLSRAVIEIGGGTGTTAMKVLAANSSTVTVGSDVNMTTVLTVDADGSVNTIKGDLLHTNGNQTITNNLNINGTLGVGSVELNRGNGSVSNASDIYMNSQGLIATDNGMHFNIITSGSFDWRVGNETSSAPVVMTLTDTGALTTVGDITAFSDITLKTNINPIENALSKLSQIRGVTFDRTDIDMDRQAGVIAQEVEKVLPEVVRTNGDGIKSVAYGNLVSLLIEAVKELKAEVDELKK